MSFKNYVAVVLLSLCSIAAMAQGKRISGKVTDPNGDPVIGAGVQQVGSTTNGVVTDADGNFAITVPDGATLNVESLGYDPQQFTVVAGQNVYNITLAEAATELDETVVIGYGTQRKRLVTGSTISVTGDAIQKQQTTDALGALYSNVPGVNLVASNGQPWSGYKINIRGLGTTGNSEPLIVIDGVAGGDISSLNPADIESIDILKDAASAAIYGARAANGVVLVTTRQAKKTDRMNIHLDASWGIQQPNFNGVRSVTAQEYMDLMNEMMVQAGQIQPGGDYYDFPGRMPVLYPKIKDGSFTGTDWLRESVNKNAPTNNYVVGFNGGSDTARYSVSFSKSYVEGTLGAPKKTYYDRTTIRANSEFSLWRSRGRDILKFGENAIVSIYDSNSVSQGTIYGNAIHTALTTTPLLPAYDSDGTYYDYADQKRDHWESIQDGTYNLLEQNMLSKDEGRTYRVQANAYLEFTPHKDWKFRTAYGHQLYARFTRSYTPAYTLSATSSKDFDVVNQSASLSTHWTWENTLSWKHKFGGHNVDALVGTSIEGTSWGESVNGKNSMTKFGTWESANLSSCEAVVTDAYVSVGGSNTVPFNRLLSFFFRANYNYKDTYLLTATFREDGSSNFAKGHRWGFFPSVSAGWIVTNEPWMNWATDAMNYFKLRASWGRNGNCNISNFQYAATVSLNAPYDFTMGGQALSTGAFPDILPNANLSWETSEQTDLGFDARFLGSRLGMTFDWYRKDTKDWLVDAPTLASYGTGAPTINGGAVRNSGVELSLNWTDKVGDFFYNIGVNGSYNKNKVLYINNSEGIIWGQDNVLSQSVDAYPSFEAREGFPIGHFIGIAYEGIFQNQAQIDEYNAKGYTFMNDGGYAAAQPGDVIWVDQNGDGNYDDDDVVEIGNPHPDYNLGVNLSFEWKGFDLSVNGSGAFGQQILSSYRGYMKETENFTTNQIARYWTGEGSTNTFPRFTNPGHSNVRCNKYQGGIWVFDADYFKIRNITFGYDLKRAIKKLPFSSLRFYFSGQNLLTFTKYDGMDPEVGYGGGVNWTSGIDIGSYPSPKTFIFGLNIKF
ncbi:MAG: TonB-dependent receptor [Bacteroidales bacterium]|nr:TonB-dependent receptor [Bacteroidales bacterium]